MTIGIKIAVESTRYGGLDQLVSAYQERVLADGGNIDETQANLVNLLNQLNGAVPDFTNSCKLFVAPHLGNKQAAGTGATAGNRAANKLYNIFGSSGDLFQATAASQPLLLRNTGVNYAYLTGVVGNYFTSPSAISNQFRDDADYAICCTPATLTNAQGLMGRQSTTAANRGISFDITSSGILRCYFRFASDVINLSTVSLGSVGITINNHVWLRVTRNASNGEIKFYYSFDPISTEPISVNWTQLGATVISTTGTTTGTSVTPVSIGSTTPETGTIPFNGQIHRAVQSASIGGPYTLDFNPQLYNRSVSQTTIPSSTGETYTINVDSNTTGLKAMIADKGLVVGNGTSYAMQSPSFAFNSEKITVYKVHRFFNNTVLSISTSIGNNAGFANGFYLAKNEGSNNTVGVGVLGNVFNGRNYTDSGVLMKISTAYADTTLSNPETDYYNNNTQATPVSQTGTGNNTSGINTTSLNFLANNNGASLWSNEAVFAELIFEGVHDATTRTNVYNILKSYFNL